MAENRSDAREILGRSARIESRERATASEAFGQLLGGAGVPGGIVSLEGCNPEPARMIEGGVSALGDALDSLALSYPSYRWEMQGGVVNVVPAVGTPSLLDTNIGLLEIDDRMSASLLLQRVFESREVQARSQELKLHLGRIGVGIGSASRPGAPPAKRRDPTVRTLRGLTVRQALNAIVLLRGKSVWSYHERICGQEGVFNAAMLVD
ncbi:MAG: hypothetical protein ACRDFW_12935 [bacterium]